MTLKEIRKTYNRYRRLYFADYDLPPANKVIFKFKRMAGEYGQTYRHDLPEAPGVYVWQVNLSPDIKIHPQFLNLVLLHEMVHIARWRLNHGPGWKEEALRLGQLGALGEFL